MKKKFTEGIIFLSSIILLIYVIFKSGLIFESALKQHFHIYLTISISITILSFLLFYINQKIKTYIYIFCISILISFYAFEFYLTFINTIPEQWGWGNINEKKRIYKKETGRNFDERSKIEILNDLKKENINTTLMVSPGWYYVNQEQKEILPLSGISNQNTIANNENGYYMVYKSDRYGFNNPDIEWDKQDTELLVIGDSYAHGLSVNRPNDISSILRTLSNKSLINLGYSGNGPLMSYASLREYFPRGVKKVFWLYFEGNDLEDLKKELKDPILSKYLLDNNYTQNLKLKQKTINSKSEQLLQKNLEKINNINHHQRGELRVSITNFVKLFQLRRMFIILPKSRAKFNIHPFDEESFKKIFFKINNFIENNGAKLYFVYLPNYPRYKFKDYRNYLNEIKTIVENFNVKFIDINEEVFLKEKDPLSLYPFKYENHYTREAYEKIANIIFESLN